MAKRTVSVGQAVKAMILNGLGFASRALYLSPIFFKDKPTERLIGPGIQPEHINDDILGRALDTIFDNFKRNKQNMVDFTSAGDYQLNQ